MNKQEMNAADIARAAKHASFALAAAPSNVRDNALLSVAAALRAKAGHIFAANEKDMEAAEKEGLSAPALKRLRFDEHKLNDVCLGLEQLAAMEDPIGKEQLRTELADGLVLSRVSCPIGVIGVIFESRPDALVQIGGLCLKSGNAVLLKGGREALHTNEALFAVLRSASVGCGLPEGWCGLLTTREDVGVMLGMDREIDLISARLECVCPLYHGEQPNPRAGSQRWRLPYLCGRERDAQMAARIAVDAKTQYPAACNAAETLLIHSARLGDALPVIGRALVEAGVELHADERARRFCMPAALPVRRRRRRIGDTSTSRRRWRFASSIRWRKPSPISTRMVRITRIAS